MNADKPVGPVDSSTIPRCVGPATFARLPRIDEVDDASIKVLGVPYDSGVSYRPGARFGPAQVREASRLLRPYSPEFEVAPFDVAQVVDAGDVALNPYSTDAAMDTLGETADALTSDGARLLCVGGDHSITLPMLRVAADRHGPIALLHFDAHLDTWDTYFGAEYTHGTPFRRAFEEGLLDTEAISHVGTRGPLYGSKDLADDRRFGFGIVTAGDLHRQGPTEIGAQLRERLGERPVYLSIDIDVLDPAYAPGTGTPEPGGISSLELLECLHALQGVNVVGADVVEVSPPYDHAHITSSAAARVAYDLTCLMVHNQHAEEKP